MSDEQTCPFCSELVKATAKKCKHCGETIDVALRAAEEAKRAAERAQGAQHPMVFMNAGGGAAAATGAALAKPRGSWFVLILWIIFFWPVAFFYYARRSW